MLCSSHPAATGQTFNIADGSVSTVELVRILAEGMGRPTRLVTVPPGLLRLGARLVGQASLFEQVCGSLVLDCSRAQALLGWQPVKPLRTGLLDMARHFVTRG